MRVFACVVWLLALPAWACDGLVLEQGWVRLSPPGMDMTAGYGTLVNRSRNAVTLDRIASPDFKGADLHQTRIENGVSQMRPGLPLTLPPGAVQLLAPGGYHLMLFDPVRELRAGAPVSMEFHCGRTTLKTSLTVRTESP